MHKKFNTTSVKSTENEEANGSRHALLQNEEHCVNQWLTVLALMTLLIISVESDISNEEWKSLSNPQSRTLFFRILQSYLEGRDSEAQAMNKKTNLKENKNSNIENTGYDKYDLFLHNDIYDV
ncbi:hypothetical protein QQF64_009778 [Cirrhinus molitorella]|uniref:Uncharacterized protein n=1 Tax=Cirrhinus molitorella TaxID=172907 RepID=A0ABR3M4G7_9TELE